MQRVLAGEAKLFDTRPALWYEPLRWAFKAPNEAVPISALGANVDLLHLTNLVLALALIGSIFLQLFRVFSPK